ncbi:MAG: Ig-like domain-containing protein [Bacteroidales bacterium]|nr:Ig-like domain-containing protein [Bacteroidales bacterium]
MKKNIQKRIILAKNTKPRGIGFVKNIFLFIICSFLLTPVVFSQTAVTFPSGSFIVNMGVFTGTRTNDIKTQLKPYGLIYDLVKNHNVPVYWVINPSKLKDGADFSYNGTTFKGGTFVVHAGNLTTPVKGRITYWIGQGVVGIYTSSSIVLNTTYKISAVPVWTLDAQNGAIATGFFANAGIPSSAYNWVLPQNLGPCNDVFVMPHADPKWITHSNLLTWNLNNKGAIWAGCHAVSALENMYNPADRSQQTNFLSERTGNYTGNNVYAENSLILWNHHKEGTPPYVITNPTEYTFPTNFGPKLVTPSDPVAQFMGISDLAHKNGSEQIFLPVKSGGWRSTTKIISHDPTHLNVPSLSNGPAAIMAYGRGFGDNNRGWVMYEAGHDINKGSIGDVPAQRAFFNWSLLSSYDKLPTINSITGIPSDARFKSQPYPQNFPLSVSYTSPISAGFTSVTWTCTRADNGNTFGSFYPNGNIAATNTTFTPSITYDDDIPCILTVKVVDACGRICFDSYPIIVIPVPRNPIAKNDLGYISSTCAIQGYSATVNPLNNDYDPDGDSLTITSLTGVFPDDGVWSINGNSVTFTPALNFFGPTTAIYTVCDQTPAGPPFFGPLCAGATIVVGVGSADENGCYPGAAYDVKENTKLTLLNLMSQQNTGALVSGSALTDNEDEYTTVNVDYLNLGTDKNNHLILSTNIALRAKDKIYLNWSKAGNGTATISIQLGASPTGPWTNSQTFSLTPNGSGATVSTASTYTIPTGVSGINYIRISAGTYNTTNSAVAVWLDGVDYDYLDCIPAVPEAYEDKVDINEDIPKVIDVIANDMNPGNLPLTLTIVSQPQHGKVSINTDNTITYITDTDYPSGGNANDTITYMICNTKGLCAVGTVSLVLIDDGCSGAGMYIPPGTITVNVTFQEGASNSVPDTYINQESDKQNINYGTISTFQIGKKPNKAMRAVMKFNNITTIPTHADIQSAVLSIYSTATSSKHNVDLSYSLYNITEEWVETGATWNNRASAQPWSTIGGTFSTPAFNTSVITSEKNKWKNFNITNMVQQWVKTPANGGIANNGFLIKQTVENSSDVKLTFASSENGTAANRPKLVVTYIIPPYICETIPNRAPLANPDNASTLSTNPVDILVLNNDADPDGNALSIHSLIGPFTGGNAVISGNKVVFTPNGIYTGKSQFKYVLSDNSGLKDTAYIYLTILNAPPMAQNDVVSVLSNSSANPINVQANDVNMDGPNPLTTSLISQPLNGYATLSGANILYTPNENFTGYDTIPYSICEPLDTNACTGVLVCDMGYIYITVENQPPVPVDENYSISPCSPYVMNLIANDFDPEHNSLLIYSVSALSKPSAGTIVNNNDGTVTYYPAVGFVGTFTFTYKLIDNGTPNMISVTSGTVSITVETPINTPPVALDDEWEMDINSIAYIAVLDNDYDPEGQNLQNPFITTNPVNGVATLQANGTIEYVPNLDFFGIDSLTYALCDIVVDNYTTCSTSLGLCDDAKVIITVYKPNVNPTLDYAIPPDGSVICEGYSIRAFITPGSGGGVGATDLYEYSIDNGLNWAEYTSGDYISTIGAVSNILIRTSRSAGSYGVPTGPIVVANWPIAQELVRPSVLEGMPANGVGICLGESVTALLTPGSGGSEGATDIIEYSISSNIWLPYVSGTPISSVGATSNIEVRTSRTGGNYGCVSTNPEKVISWPIKPLPNPPVPIVTQPTCSEFYGSVVLEGLPIEGWTITPDYISGITQSIEIEYLLPGTYTYALKNEVTGCQSSPVNIFVQTPPEPPAPVIVDDDIVSCGGSVLIHADGGMGGTIYFQDTISNGTSIAKPSVLELITTTGYYYFRARSEDGCWGEQGRTFVQIIDMTIPFTLSEKYYISEVLEEGGLVNISTNATWNNQNWLTVDENGNYVSISFTPTDTNDVLIYKGECMTPVVDIINPGFCRNLTISNGTIVNQHPGTVLNVLGNFTNQGLFVVYEEEEEHDQELIFVKGNWNNEAGEFRCGKGKVIFDGPGVQEVDTRYSPFYDLDINQPNINKALNEVLLNQETTVKNKLNLKKGSLNLNQNTLIIENNQPSSIVRDLGFIYAEFNSTSLYSKVRWNIGNLVENYTIPFGKSEAEYIPLRLDIKSNHMSSEAYLDFSTYGTESDNYPAPLMVEHLGEFSDGLRIADRYWYIGDSGDDETPYLSVEGEITFTYLSDELGDIFESDMIAQRYNPRPDSSFGVWADLIYSQNLFSDWTNHGFSVNSPIPSGGNTGTFTTSYVDTAQFFNVWVLSDINNPLPIKLLKFEAECQNDVVELNWITATEINNHFFTIEKSTDGYNWEVIATVLGANNSSTDKYYSYNHNNPEGLISYYRLKQTDYDGKTELFNTVIANCGVSENENILVYPNPATDNLNIYLQNLEESGFNLRLSDAIGNIVYTHDVNKNVDESMFININLTNLSAGFYFLEIRSDGNFYKEKIIKN